MNHDNEDPYSFPSKFREKIVQNDKTEKIRMTIAIAILGIYLGSMVIAGIYQLL